MLPRPGDRSSVRQQIEFEKSFWVMCVCGVWPSGAGSLYLEVRKYSMPRLIPDHLKIQY